MNCGFTEELSASIVECVMLQIWPRVKAANPHLSSVCELGAIVGSMWRDLGPADKQYYNDQFTRDKVSDMFAHRCLCCGKL